MGRTILAEETVRDYISSLYGVHQWQIGLILGQLTSQRDYIVHLAKTPDQTANTENDESEEKKKPKSVGDVNENWAVEHAHQVSRMLTGGLEVIGVFAFGPSNILSKTQGKLRQLLFSIYKTTTLNTVAFFDAEDTISSRIILQICSQTKRITCRTLDVSDATSTAQPADLKFQSFLNRWTRLETKISLDLEFKIPSKLEKAALNNRIMDSLESSLHEITGAVCTVNGMVLPSDQLLVASEKQMKSSQQTKKSTTEPMKVELYLNNPCVKSNVKPTLEESIGTITVQGVVYCRACVNQKATCGDAVQAVKCDAVRSILSRFEVLCEDILESQDQQNTESLESSWACPKRVFVHLGKGPLSVCDYMFKDETLQDSLNRVSELMDVEPAQEDVQFFEKIPDDAQIEDILDERKSRNEEREKLTTSSVNSQSGAQKRSRGTFIGALVGLVTALAAAGIAFIWGDQALA